MNILQRIVSFFGRLLSRERQERTAPTVALSTAPREPVNDALAYGVAIAGITPAPGAWYWQAVRVHHLTPEENNGNHHIYLDLLDPELGDGSNPNGGRVFGGRVRVTWDSGEQIVVVDKPLNEPGTNFPMWRWQVCAVEALGLPGQELPSDRVTGIQTGHPDEAPGNTLFHHSFSVTFVKVQAPTVVTPTDSVISGRVRNGAGRTLRLVREGQAYATTTVAADETYQFTGLPAGEYRVLIAGTEAGSGPVTVDGRNSVTADLVAPAPDKRLTHTVLFGPAGDQVTLANMLLAQDYLLAFKPSFSFNPAEAAEAEMVTIIAGEDAVPAEVATQLAAAGIPVQRITGTVEEVAQALAARIAQRQAF